MLPCHSSNAFNEGKKKIEIPKKLVLFTTYVTKNYGVVEFAGINTGVPFVPTNRISISGAIFCKV
jgi:hypothetical protein